MERIWIYQADRVLDAEEQQRILSRLATFTEQWRAHGKALVARVEIRHDAFVIITVDDSVAAPTGCSIDKSVHLLKEIESELGVGFFDRMKIAYKESPDSPLSIVGRDEFQQLIDCGKITAASRVFNNLIQSYAELEDAWELPLADSWHARVFDNVPYSA